MAENVAMPNRGNALTRRYVVLAALVCLGTACSGAAPTSPTATKTGGTLRVGLEGESAGWLQTAATGGYSTYFAMDALFDSIMKLDEKGQPQAFLAQSVTPDASYGVWTIKLRPDVLYSDGTPLNAATMKAMFDELLAPTSSARGTLSDIKSVDTTDDLTVQITLNAPSAWFAYVLSNIMVFKPGLKDQYGDDYTAHPVGTGPFVMSQWDRNQQLVVKKNPNYWRKDADGRQLPLLDQIIFKPIVNADSRLASVRAGDLDTMMSSDPNALTKADQASLAVTYLLNNSGYEFAFNTSKPPLDDVRVRQALAYATDRAAVVAAAGGDPKYQVVRYQYFAADDPFFSSSVDDAALKYDAAKAKEVLAQYVNDPNRSDGKPVGTQPGFEILSVPDANTVAQDQVAQSEWNQAGFNVTIKTEDQPARITDVTKGLHEGIWIQWGQQDPYHVLGNRYRDTSTNVNNYARFNNPQIQSDLDKLVSQSPTDAKATIADIGKIVDQQVPAVLLGAGVIGFASSSKVKGGPIVLSGQSVYRTDWAPISLE
jgi:peptide/nickel transport system substrate-binding protein